MRRLLTMLLLLSTTTLICLAQVPNYFNYQAVVRNSSGEIINGSNVSFRISILQNSKSGNAIYVETHTTKTNEFGLVNLIIGDGTSVSGNFNPGDWGTNSHFIKVEMDPDGGTAFVNFGTSQLMSVPYAFHAKTVETDLVEDDDADPENELQSLSISGTQLTLSDGGGTVTLPSSGGGDNWGTQTVESDATLTGEGTTANPLSVVGVLTDNQTLSIKNNELSIKNGNTVTLPAGSSSLWSNNGDNIYYNSGKVMLGTTTPNNNAILTLNGGSQNTWISFTNNASGNTSNDGFQIGPTSDNSRVYLWNLENSPIIFGTNNQERLRISEDGHVGIGTDPSGGARTFQVIKDNELTIAAENNTLSLPTLYLKNKAGGIAAWVEGELTLRDGTQGLGKVLTSDEMGDASWQTPDFSYWEKNGSNIYYNDGKVGIGTTNPSYALSINSKAESAYITLQNNLSGSSGTDGFALGISNTYGDVSIWNFESSSMLFGTNGQERMTISSGGNVGIGTRSPSAGLHLKGSGYPSSFMYLEAPTGQDAGFRLYESSTAKWHIFNNANAGGLQIYNSAAKTALFAKQSNSYVGIGTTSPTQALHVVGNAYKTEGGTSWATSSDIRLKNILGDYTKGLNEINALHAVRYIYKKDNPRQLNPTAEQTGFVAQEVQKVFPEAVSEGEDGYLDFNIHPINIALVNAVKELNTENEQLRSKVNKLESRLEEIESIVKVQATK